MQRSVLCSVFGSAFGSLLLLPALVQAQSAAASTPDLNGIWQAMNTANWELEAHAAEAGPIASLGALLAVPAGVGYVVEGNIPYLPAALEKR